jgi:hypothetical protein
MLWVTLYSSNLHCWSTSYTLQERLEYLDNKSFISEELLEGGLSAPTAQNESPTVSLRHWSINFNGSQFNWSHSDISESGSYGVLGHEIALDHFNDRHTAMKVFPDDNAIEFGGHRYVLQTIEDKGAQGSL